MAVGERTSRYPIPPTRLIRNVALANCMARLNVATERKDNKIRIFVTFVLYNHKFSSSDKQQPLAWNEEEKVSGVFKAHHNRSEEHTSELQSLMRNSYAVFFLKKKN